MNRAPKETLIKFVLETGENWTTLLPLALQRARCIPYREGFSPYEIIYGRPPPLLPKLQEEMKTKIHNQSLLKSLQALQSVQQAVHKLSLSVKPRPFPCQSLCTLSSLVTPCR